MLCTLEEFSRTVDKYRSPLRSLSGNLWAISAVFWRAAGENWTPGDRGPLTLSLHPEGSVVSIFSVAKTQLWLLVDRLKGRI